MVNCLLDTNIILDTFLEREEFVEDSRKILHWIDFFYMDGFITQSQVTDIYYITKKKFDDETARDLLKSLYPRVWIKNSLGADSFWCLQGSEGEGWNDFEDALLYQAALIGVADYIITRDLEGFKNSKIKVIHPKEFVEKIGPTLEDPFRDYR